MLNAIFIHLKGSTEIAQNMIAAAFGWRADKNTLEID